MVLLLYANVGHVIFICFRLRDVPRLAKKPPLPTSGRTLPNPHYTQLRSFAFSRSAWKGYEHRKAKAKAHPRPNEQRITHRPSSVWGTWKFNPVIRYLRSCSESTLILKPRSRTYLLEHVVSLLCAREPTQLASNNIVFPGLKDSDSSERR